MLNVSLTAGYLQDALNLAGLAVLEPKDRGALIPVYSHLLITAEAGADHITLMSFDGVMRVSAKCAAHIISAGQIAVRAMGFMDYIRNLEKGAQVVIKESNDRKQITTGRMKINLTSDSQAEPDLWPTMPGAVGDLWLQMPPVDIAMLIDRVRWATAGNDARPALEGVYISNSGNLVTAYGGDGWRIARQAIELGYEPEFSHAVIMPAGFIRAAVDFLRRMPSVSSDDENPEPVIASLWTDDNSIALECLGNWLTAPLVEAAYPSLTPFLEYKPAGVVTLPKQELVTGIVAADVISRENSSASGRKHLMVIEFDSPENRLRLSATSPETGGIRVDIPAQFDYSRIGYQTRADWLRQAVQIIPDEWHPRAEGMALLGSDNHAKVTLRFHAPESPVIVSAPELEYWSIVPAITDGWLAQFDADRAKKEAARKAALAAQAEREAAKKAEKDEGAGDARD